jgi:hypothetical protein
MLGLFWWEGDRSTDRALPTCRYTNWFTGFLKTVFRRGIYNAFDLNGRVDRAIAQAVSRWLLTASAKVRAQVTSCGICDGQSGNGAGFLRVLRFPLPILITPTAPRSSSVIQGWYNRTIIGRRTKCTQSHPQETKKTKTIWESGRTDEYNLM